MPRTFEFSVESVLGVDQIHRAYRAEDYWLARLAAYGGGTLESFGVDADGAVTVVVVQDLRSSLLPGPLAKLYPRDLQIVQHETWRLTTDTELRGEARTTARGAPGSALSVVTMAPAAVGSHLDCSGRLTVKMPLVGGTVEGMLARQMVDETPEMLRFTATWVDGKA